MPRCGQEPTLSASDFIKSADYVLFRRMVVFLPSEAESCDVNGSTGVI